MKLSLEFLEHCSAETGFQVVVLEKVTRMGEIAGHIARHPTLGEVLALKGGTALNLCLGAPTRLSVDLDFNYIGSETREGMLVERPKVREAILTLAGRLGYRAQESAEAFSGGKIYLSYRSVLGPQDRIEIDLNFVFRIPFSGTLVQRLWQPDALDQPDVRIVGVMELLIGKLLALLDRGAARDVWDVANLPKAALQVVESDEFRRLFIAFSATLPHPLTTYTRRRLENLATDQVLTDQLLPMLMRNVAPNLSTLVPQAWDVIADILNVATAEAEYIASIEQGEIRTELLFPNDSGKAALVARHPAIRWKIKNVRDKLERQRRL